MKDNQGKVRDGVRTLAHEASNGVIVNLGGLLEGSDELYQW